MSEEKGGAPTLVSAVSDGVFIFAAMSNNTIWLSHPHLPPLTWQQLPAIPAGENIKSLGVTFCERDPANIDSTLFMVTNAGNLWFFNGTGWDKESTP
jgi:hypothetical protein